MKKIFLTALMTLLISGCYNIDYRPLRDSEYIAVKTVHESIPTSFECVAAERYNLFVREAPQRVISRYCSGGRRDTGTLACVTSTYENGPFTPGANMHISWDSGFNLHHNLIRHEALHVLLGCLYRDQDRNHRRDEWKDVLPEARKRFLELFPGIPDPDPYSIEETPWDLTGTPWEGEDCDVQPHAWIDQGIVPWCSSSDAG